MTPDDWQKRCSDLLAQRRERQLLRQRQIVRPIDSTHIEVAGRTYLNFSSNDYLGLTHHPRMLEAARSVTASGSGAAGLITGYTESHARAEQAIAQWKETEAAVILPSGYQANLAAVQALAGIGQTYPKGVRFLFDKLSHASLVDAVQATSAPMRVFPHNGMPKLKRLLERAEPGQLQIVLTESIFSMDGDAAPLRELAELKRDHGFVFLLDEAHGSGVYGRNGAGLAAELGLQAMVDVSIVTLSKALGCGGGAVCGLKVFAEALVNLGRAYIYSTSVPPIIPACVEAAMSILQNEPHRQKRVRELAGCVRSELREAGLMIPDGDSPIIPIVLGAESTVLDASNRLKEAGLWIAAVRPPTVPAGACRLRITLSSEHTDQDVTKLIRAVSELSH